MNKFSIFTLKALRKIYAKTFSVKPLSRPESIQDADIASKLIYDKLMSKKPCMVARLGATELMTMVNYLGVHKAGKKNIFKYVQGKELDWWWNENCLRQMEQWSGFFPPTVEKIEQFCELMLDDMKEVDILGSWLANERYFEDKLKNKPKLWLDFLLPFFSSIPWSKVLSGKKVLVIHPFARTIEKQYSVNRTQLFKNEYILPDFELQTIQAVQSLGGETNGFSDWFAALEWMKQEIDKRDYDVCLIGCGAYGFPLAAYVKRQGKKSVHLGGALQLLFGIKGKRWEDPNLNKNYCIADCMNEYWVRPLEQEKPKNASSIEDACYW
jgi:hypothetical protein